MEEKVLTERLCVWKPKEGYVGWINVLLSIINGPDTHKSSQGDAFPFDLGYKSRYSGFTGKVRIDRVPDTGEIVAGLYLDGVVQGGPICTAQREYLDPSIQV